jgi:hypothetical protein
MSNLYRGLPIDASYQVSLSLAGVSEEKIKMWKVNGWRTTSDGKSSHCLWQDELKTMTYVVRNSVPGLGRAQKCGEVKPTVHFSCFLKLTTTIAVRVNKISAFKINFNYIEKKRSLLHRFNATHQKVRLKLVSQTSSNQVHFVYIVIEGISKRSLTFRLYILYTQNTYFINHF